MHLTVCEKKDDDTRLNILHAGINLFHHLVKSVCNFADRLAYAFSLSLYLSSTSGLIRHHVVAFRLTWSGTGYRSSSGRREQAAAGEATIRRLAS
jgi:hypothetical protein